MFCPYTGSEIIPIIIISCGFNLIIIIIIIIINN